MATNHTEHVTLALPSATGVSRVDLFPRDDAGYEGRGFPAAFDIQVAGDAACTSWQTVVSRNGYPKPGRFRQTFGLSSRVVSCVRVVGRQLDVADAGYYLFQLGEIKLYH